MNQPKMYESDSISVTFFSNMAAYRGCFEDEDDELYRELYSGRNIDFTLKNHCPTRPLFYFFRVAIRFD